MATTTTTTKPPEPRTADPAALADRRKTAWRVGLVAALLGYLVLAAANGFDRIALSDPRFASLVPQGAQVGALAARADRFVEAGIPRSAVDDAALLVARDPLNTHGAGLLGAARLAQGDVAGANAAFRVSAQLGWRDARTQLYWLRMALAAQDYDRAALHFGALARQWPTAPAIANIAEVIEATPAGRTALARRIAAGDDWAQIYAVPREGMDGTGLVQRAAVLAEAAARGKRLGCEPAAALVRALARVDSAAAARVWQGQCPDSGTGGLLRDGGFSAARLTPPATPLDWDFTTAGALDLRLGRSDRGGIELSVRNDGAISRPFAAQQLVAGRATYRLRLQGRITKGTLRAGLGCTRASQSSGLVTVVPGSGGPGADIGFSGECSAPWFELWLSPGGAAEIGGLHLTRL